MRFTSIKYDIDEGVQRRINRKILFLLLAALLSISLSAFYRVWSDTVSMPSPAGIAAQVTDNHKPQPEKPTAGSPSSNRADSTSGTNGYTSYSSNRPANMVSAATMPAPANPPQAAISAGPAATDSTLAQADDGSVDDGGTAVPPTDDGGLGGGGSDPPPAPLPANPPADGSGTGAIMGAGGNPVNMIVSGLPGS